MKISAFHPLQKLALASVLSLTCAAASAQSYTYTPESFEEAAWTTKGTTVKSATGTWTTNKNVSTADQAMDGSKSLLISAKDGIVTPELKEGAGTLIYYALDQNRQVYVETSPDNSQWTQVEAYKESTAWTKHSVTINDKATRYIRLRTTSNNNFYIDNLLVTLPDGTDGNGNQVVTSLVLPYFTNDFENRDSYPSSRDEAASEAAFNVTGQGEWKYLNAYRGTNVAYIPDGSTADLRMLKNGSYVISPILSQGVVNITFDEGRSGRTLKIYTSTDGGETWTETKTVSTETHNTITLSEKSVNRVKIANESSSDADLDNLTITAFPEGMVATVTTGDITEITSSSAIVAGSIDNNGGKSLIEAGVCWSVNENPSVFDNAVSSSSFPVKISGLPAGCKIYCRAYGVTLAGVGYGITKEFSTLAPSTASVTTSTVITVDNELSDEMTVYVRAHGDIIDFGGITPDEFGICYSTTPDPTIDSPRAKGLMDDTGMTFSAILPLTPSTDYYIRAYVTNASGTAYGNAVAYTSPAIDVPEYPHNVYYCDPQGDDSTADGSKEKPFYNLQLAVDRVKAGDCIYMNAGTYRYSSRINIPAIGEKNSGMILLHANGGRAVLDFSAMPVDDANQGIRLTGSYWHFYGIDICGAGDNGLLIERNKPTGGSYNDIAAAVDEAHHNLIECCNFYRNRDTGLQMKNLASYNMVVNCDSYFNADPDHGDADGFAVKISQGDANYFYGCRAWNNSDDGWDQYIKKDGGFPDDITTTLEHCWAFNNGYLEGGVVGHGNGNGFKMGSNQGRNNIIMNRCMAFNNLQKGFDQNHNTGNMILNNCTGYSAKYLDNSSHYSYRMDEAVAADHEIRFTNCVAVSDGIADRNKSAYAPYSVTGTKITCDFNTRPSDYVSIDPTGTDGPRDADGSLPEVDFMKIASGNFKLIDAGTEVAPFEGESVHSCGISFMGNAPDLGCFETDEVASVETIDIRFTQSSSRLTATVTLSGPVILTIEGATPASLHKATAVSLDGKLLSQKLFNGSTAAIELPAGISVISVTGTDINESIKVIR